MSSYKDRRNSKPKNLDTYTIPNTINEINSNLCSRKISINNKNEIMNKGFEEHLNGNIKEAARHYESFINKGFIDYRVFSNFGSILKDLGELKEAEIFTRKAISLKKDFSEGYSNLGSILKDTNKLKEAKECYKKALEIKPSFADANLNLASVIKDLGNLEEAENYAYKAIKLNPNLIKAYYLLSTLKDSYKNLDWQEKILSDEILDNKSSKELIDIYFTRANIYHRRSKFNKSQEYLKLGNNKKLHLNKSNAELFFKRSEKFFLESEKININSETEEKLIKDIFIVGMFRSGSTLLESILGMNCEVYNLGESNIFEESFLEWKKLKVRNKNANLSQIYRNKVNELTNGLKINTNKMLYNYQYSGIISKQIPTAKIIHCFRNPFDNILSIYRSNFAKGNYYTSSLSDCAKVYLDQEILMSKYKKIYKSKIYDLNYDLLVTNPKKEIKSLISWLGWEWEDNYLYPHLNNRSVTTTSSVQVRSPIHSKSIGGWKNYEHMLLPAITIIKNFNKYKNL